MRCLWDPGYDAHLHLGIGHRRHVKDGHWIHYEELLSGKQ